MTENQQAPAAPANQEAPQAPAEKATATPAKKQAPPAPAKQPTAKKATAKKATAKKATAPAPAEKQAPPAVAKEATASAPPEEHAPPEEKRTPAARTMSDSHKRALAEGREIGRAVRTYLEALEAHQPRRGRRRTPESIQVKLDKLVDQIDGADPMSRVALVQERIDLQNELSRLTDKVDLADTERAFVDVAKRYSELKGISYAAWREVGVPAPILKAAGVRRSD